MIIEFLVILKLSIVFCFQVSLGVLLHPLGGSGIVLGLVGQVLLGDFVFDGVVGGLGWVEQDASYGFEHELSVECWDPVGLDGSSADLALVSADTGVVNLCDELHFGALEGIVVTKIDLDDEVSTSEWSAGGSCEGHVPQSCHVLVWHRDCGSLNGGCSQVIHFLKSFVSNLMSGVGISLPLRVS